MYIIAMILFVGGVYLFGLAFQLPAFQAVVFFAGIVAVGLAMALPMYARSSARFDDGRE